MKFNWEDHKVEIEAACESHKAFMREHGEFLGNPDTSAWAFVFWWSGERLERYDVGELEEAQAVVDYYHFSKARTRVVMRDTCEDVTDRIKFNPSYHDTFKK